ncbi:putative ribonuclease H-like domain-containing protein [Tanacetum coccineum]
MDIKWKMAMLSVRVNKFEKKAGRKIEFDKKEAARFNKKAVRCYKFFQKGHFARECRTQQGNEKRYSSFKIQELRKKEAATKALIGAAEIYSLITGNDHIDLDESQMSYGTKSSTSGDSNSVSNDFVSCDNSDKSLEVNTNDFASSDSSVKSSEPSQMILPPVHQLPANPYSDAEDEGIFDSGCSRSMTGNMERLDDFQEFQRGKVTFGGDEGRITRKGTIRTPTLYFENVYYVKELQQFNLFSISQICDKKNRVLFTDTDCIVLSKDFMLPDESMVVLRVPKKHNLYTINLNNLSPRGNLTCLVAKASVDESVKWHRRMGHVNYKNMNRLASNTKPLIRFCWVFFLEHKDETYPILKDFINLVENQLNKKVKAIRCDNGTEFKNAHIIELCGSKGIKRDYSNARTPQQNGVAERKNRTLIEAARTMLADSKLPTMFWTEAVRTACYVLNRVLVTSPHNKTPYALLTGNIPSVSHFKPFGCHVTILNTSDHLGKFDGKADEGYIVGYSASNKAYRVYNVPTKKVEETMNLRYLEEKPNVQGLGHEWYFDFNYLTDSLGYKHDKANQSARTHEASTNPAGTQDADLDSECDEQVIIIPSYPSHSIQEVEPKDISGDEVADSPLDSAEEIFQKDFARMKGQEQRATSDAKDTEELQERSSTKLVPTSSIQIPSGETTISPSDVLVPTGSIQIPSGETTISPGDVLVPTGGVPVPGGSPTDSFFDDAPTT